MGKPGTPHLSGMGLPPESIPFSLSVLIPELASLWFWGLFQLEMIDRLCSPNLTWLYESHHPELLTPVVRVAEARRIAPVTGD